MNWDQITSKLGEARFFLHHLKQEASKTPPKEPADFGYYLSAFLTPAYTVMYLLDDGAKDALRQQRAKVPLDDREILNRLWAQRDFEVHADGAEIVTKKKAIPAEQLPGVQVFGSPAPLVNESEEIKREREQLGLPPGTQSWVYLPERYFKFKGDDVQPTHLCDRLLRVLEKLVQEVQGA